MRKIIKQTQIVENFLGQPPPFEEVGSARIFRRIVGGLQWPGANPGALVILAEDLQKDPVLGERKLWVLSEYSSGNLSEVVIRCGELKRLKSVEKFYADTTDRAMMKVSLKCRTEAQISLSKAPLIDEPTAYMTYLNLIREKTSATKKALYFKEESALQALLSSLTVMPTDLKSDYPQIAALGYALSALVLYPFKKLHWSGVSYGPRDPVVGI